jgi:hypothetical protein
VNPLVTTFFATGQPKESRELAVSGQPLSDSPVGASEWWLDRLLTKMNTRNVYLSKMRAYYRGENETWQFASRAHRDTFGEAFRNLKANLAKPVVEAPEQRLRVIGLTFWDDDAGSEMAWDIWLQNQLEARSSEAHLEALSTGICPIIVSPWRTVAPGIPLITKEDPLAVIVEHDPADTRTRVAALKVWLEDDGRRTAILYLPDRIEWWRTEQRVEFGSKAAWRIVEGEGGDNPLGVVPVVELQNAPSARAEHEGVTDQLDLYAKTLYDMSTAAHYSAYRQRWATGVDMGEEGTEVDADGNAIASPPAASSSGPDTAVTTESPDARFGSFDVSDLVPFIRVLETHRSDIATISFTPHRLLVPPPTSVPPSGESVRLSDHPLTTKVERKQVTLGNGWETVIRLAFLARGDQVRSRRMDLETEWADPELHTESEHMDALMKAQAMGVPQEYLWRQMGATPQQIRRWKAQTPPPAPEPQGDMTDAPAE